VLVAAADRDTADSTATLVRRWGHDARAAYDGAEALDVAWTYHPDVALLDVAMPRFDGCHVARALRQRAAFGATLLVAVSGCQGEAERRQAEMSGFDHYVLKPADPDLLEHLLRHRRELKEFVREVRRARLETADRVLQSAAHMVGLRASIDRLGASARKTRELLRREGRPPTG
jgi:CheY-like chemotaxis protein